MSSLNPLQMDSAALRAHRLSSGFKLFVQTYSNNDPTRWPNSYVAVNLNEASISLLYKRSHACTEMGFTFASVQTGDGLPVQQCDNSEGWELEWRLVVRPHTIALVGDDEVSDDPEVLCSHEVSIPLLHSALSRHPSDHGDWSITAFGLHLVHAEMQPDELMERLKHDHPEIAAQHQAMQMRQSMTNQAEVAAKDAAAAASPRRSASL